MMLASHPGIVLIAGALLMALFPGRWRVALALVAPICALAVLWNPSTLPATSEGIRFLEFELTPLRIDKVSRLFATIFLLMAFAGALFAAGQRSRIELPAALVYAGSAVGVALAGDLITLFIFWELMAIASTLVIWSARTPTAYRASHRYLMLHLAGGVLLLMGIAGHVAATHSIAFDGMAVDSIAHGLILAAFLINAGAPPLSGWLPDAYPEASWSGMVFLSAFTTKAAVYALLRGFPGAEVLIYVGVFMIFYGIVYALLENDMRRILAYSIINQVGFMIVGIGIGTQMALNGAAAHAFTHILYKALLLMSAGSVFYLTGKRKCTDLGGLYQSMPITTLCAIVGAMAISAFPFTSGFISKSMVTQAAADQHLLYLWLALAAASAGVFLHAGIKFPWFVFFQRDSGQRPPDPPWNMCLSMILLAAMCLGLGWFYEPFYRLLPYDVNYVPYTTAHVVAQLQLLLFSGLAFFVMLNWLKRTLTITLDVDWIYRVPMPAMLHVMERQLIRLQGAGGRFASTTLAVLNEYATRLFRPPAAFASTWSIRSMALWMMLLLLIIMLGYYL